MQRGAGQTNRERRSGEMNRSKILTCACLTAALLTNAYASTAHCAVTVDGDLSEWGVALNASKHLTFSGGIVNNGTNPGNRGALNNFMGSGSTLYYHAEDSSDFASDTAYLGPYYGGQNYDGEFLGVMVQGAKLCIAIATGQRPDNGLSQYSPGDLRIETSNGVFGIEMGGGTGSISLSNGSFGLGSQGTSYNLNGQGVTVSAINYSGTGTAGSIWSVNDAGDWILDGVAHKVPVQLNHNALTTADQAGTASSFIYNFGSDLGQHAFIELTLDLHTLFGSGHDVSLNSIFWSPSCDNDELSVNLGGIYYSNPEPASIAIWGGIGALAAAAFCHRRSKQRV